MKTGKINNIVFAGRFEDKESLSGPEKFSKRILEYYSYGGSAGNPVFIQYFFEGNKYSLVRKLYGLEESEHHGFKLYRAGLFKFYKLLKQLRPRIIHITAFERFSVVAILYRLLNSSKVVYTSHGTVKYENAVLKKLPFMYRLKDSICERLLFRFSDLVVFPSAQALQISAKYYKFTDRKTAIIPNGIDSIFQQSRPEAEIADQAGKPLRAVFIYKNVLNSSGLQFLKKYLQSGEHKIKIYIISETARIIDGSRSGVEIVPTMSAEELAEFYKDKDIFLSLNEYDTFSISTAEAMASGLIPVVTRQTGISSLIKNGVNGFQVEYGDIESLRDILDKIHLTDEKDRRTMKRNASEIYKLLNWDIISELYSKQYDKLCRRTND